jgi:hypothetical protein
LFTHLAHSPPPSLPFPLSLIDSAPTPAPPHRHHVASLPITVHLYADRPCPTYEHPSACVIHPNYRRVTRPLAACVMPRYCCRHPHLSPLPSTAVEHHRLTTGPKTSPCTSQGTPRPGPTRLMTIVVLVPFAESPVHSTPSFSDPSSCPSCHRVELNPY